MSFTQIIMAILGLIASTGLQAADADLMAVSKRFDEYVELSAKFDVSVSEIYSDEAVIKTDRHMPNGEVRKLQMDGKSWKKMIRDYMPLAKQREDINTYTEVKVEAADGEKVKVTAQRTSKLKNHTTPISWLFTKSADGKWLIIEEQSVTKS